VISTEVVADHAKVDQHNPPQKEKPEAAGVTTGRLITCIAATADLLLLAKLGVNLIGAMKTSSKTMDRSWNAKNYGR